MSPLFGNDERVLYHNAERLWGVPIHTRDLLLSRHRNILQTPFIAPSLTIGDKLNSALNATKTKYPTKTTYDRGTSAPFSVRAR